jgi:hypothetical protein
MRRFWLWLCRIDSWRDNLDYIAYRAGQRGDQRHDL